MYGGAAPDVPAALIRLLDSLRDDKGNTTVEWSRGRWHCLIHAPNESVDPGEIEHLALAEALFLSTYTR
jgi:hypothetical protein